MRGITTRFAKDTAWLLWGEGAWVASAGVTS